MYSRLTSLLLLWLRVPPEPHPPHGNPDSLRVFRAGRNFYNLRLARWGFTQLLALAGIIFWVTVFIDVEAGVAARRQSQSAPPAQTVESFAKTVERVGREAGAKGTRRHGGGLGGFTSGLIEIAARLPWWAFPVLWVLKGAGILAYLAQLPVTYAIARLDFEMRWYMVTDRSLRIRHGVWKISESTMSFANIQQVEVSQGPLQRLLGLADVKVQSAGGGGGGAKEHQHGTEDDMHHGLFHSVTNATDIRDLILERLRRFRESGLGDPEEKGHAIAPATLPSVASAQAGDLLAAARELAAEARALRASLM